MERRNKRRRATGEELAFLHERKKQKAGDLYTYMSSVIRRTRDENERGSEEEY